MLDKGSAVHGRLDRGPASNMLGNNEKKNELRNLRQLTKAGLVSHKISDLVTKYYHLATNFITMGKLCIWFLLTV